MLKKVKEALLLPRGKRVAVAVSGGADSVALLSVMLKLKSEYGIDVFAAHFNHKLRGEESERDMFFVKKLCADLGVELVCGEGDVGEFAREHKLSTELAARQMRYDFFDELPADYVATAHTASDNLETVIFNLTRGSGIAGLCGIPPKRGRYIRPLIFCTRDEIEAYCRKENLGYVTDSTNLCDDYSRNLIRHKVVPVLKQLNPSVENSVANTSVELAFDRDALDFAAKDEYKKRLCKEGLKVDGLAESGMATAGRVLRLFCLEKTGELPDYRHTNDLFGVAVSGGRCGLSGGATAMRQKNILKILFPYDTPRYKVSLEKIKNDLIKKDKKVNNLLLKNLFDCDKIAGEAIVRTRESGDKIRLLGRGCTKTLKQLFNESGIPLFERDVLPVIADDKGVVWVCGFGVAERVAPDENSAFICKISYEIISGGNNTK